MTQVKISDRKKRFGKILFLLQSLSVLSTVVMAICNIWMDISWWYVFMPVLITFGVPLSLVLIAFSILILLVMVFGKRKGVKDIGKLMKKKE